MGKQIKSLMINIVGAFLTLIGAIFIVLPGPTFLFLPIGLAILSLEHAWAKVWLRHCQRMMRKGAVKMDALIAKLTKRKNANNR
ncbi:PGPGW domain-containing protein [Pseudocolwellia sp. HL-MZ19]|uniref:PGPGW domain-containing protein n=1 Tax=Pseudocolwellia sp. HL-MZ19 TaxID=3400846 RepID=UPI003CEDE7CE